MSDNTQAQEVFAKELRAKSLQAIKLEVIVPAMYEIVGRLEARAKDEKAPQNESKQAKTKKRYWDAVLTLVFTGYLQ